MIGWIETVVRRLGRFLNPAQWIAWVWRLPSASPKDLGRGLVMIQIDGLSLRCLESAVAEGRLPFIRRLIRGERYALHPLYTGLPASTPAIQGELFYGVRGAVPAFQYFDRGLSRLVNFFEPDTAARLEKKLAQQGLPLLEGGSAYSDIFTGGAKEAHFCMASVGWGHGLQARRLFATVLLLLRVGLSPRGLLYFIMESTLAVTMAISGILKGQNIAKELGFIVSRLTVCGLLREFIAAAAIIDIVRGLPVIHLNLVGYDEYAHRRGPSSAFAAWALKGIDRVVQDIWKAAHRSSHRLYDVWVYSDHGQEEAIAYRDLSGESLAVTASRAASKQHLRVAATATMGPVGHIYLASRPTAAERSALASQLIAERPIPCILSAGHPGLAHAWTQEGQLGLPGQADRLLGQNHPFHGELAGDLVSLAHHPDAGDLVLLGWQPGKKSVTWEAVNGSHGGPGSHETQAFALLPSDTALPSGHRAFLRPWDLRQAALHILGKDTEQAPTRVVRMRAPGHFRVMTYNVHGCRGMDGRLSIERVARVIATHHPDVVALQELDVGRKRSGQTDQAGTLAHLLGMHQFFFPAVQEEHEQFGDAILSRHPMRLVRQGRLPGEPTFSDSERRGALWATVHLHGREVQIVNTHLSIWAPQSRRQAEALMGTDWVGHPDCRYPVIVLGDMNAWPGSPTWRLFQKRLHDAQLRHAGYPSKKTWFGRFPVGCIDHVFVSEDLTVTGVDIPDTELEKIASDHLPVVVDVAFQKTLL